MMRVLEADRLSRSEFIANPAPFSRRATFSRRVTEVSHTSCLPSPPAVG